MDLRIGRGLALAATLALAACGGEDESISGVVPGDVFAGRTASVLISGDNTEWDDGVSVSFGDGVTVSDVVVASPTALWVTIAVADDATLGPRDVTVDDLAFSGAFDVISPIQISAVQGVFAQGSVATIRVQNLDFTTPFDTTDGNMEVVVPADAGMLVIPGTAEAYSFEFSVFTDVTAAPGAIDLELLSGPPGGEVESFKLPGALELVAREATVVDVDGLTGTFGDAGDSALFRLEPSSIDVVTFVGSFDDPNGFLQFFVLGDSGSFADLVAIGQPGFFDPIAQVTMLTEQPVYVIVSDISGLGGYGFELTPTIEAVIGDQVAAEAEPNDADADAQALALPLMVTAELSSETDQDWYEIVINAGESGRSLVVFTTAGPTGGTDTTVTVFENNGTTIVLDEVDLNFGELAITEPLPQGTYYVRVQNTGGAFTPAPGPYDLAIGLAPETP